jgi:plasmid stability protein
VPQFTLRHIPVEVWAAVKARAATEHPHGQSFQMEAKLLYVLRAYVRLGWRELVRRLDG